MAISRTKDLTEYTISKPIRGKCFHFIWQYDMPSTWPLASAHSVDTICTERQYTAQWTVLQWLPLDRQVSLPTTMFTTKKKTTSVSCVEIQIFLISFIAVLSFLLGKDCNYFVVFLKIIFQWLLDWSSISKDKMLRWSGKYKRCERHAGHLKQSFNPRLT